MTLGLIHLDSGDFRSVPMFSTDISLYRCKSRRISFELHQEEVRKTEDSEDHRPAETSAAQESDLRNLISSPIPPTPPYTAPRSSRGLYSHRPSRQHAASGTLCPTHKHNVWWYKDRKLKFIFRQYQTKIESGWRQSAACTIYAVLSMDIHLLLQLRPVSKSSEYLRQFPGRLLRLLPLPLELSAVEQS